MKTIGAIAAAVLVLMCVVGVASAKEKKECTQAQRDVDWENECLPAPPPDPADVRAAASESQKFFIPDLGDTANSVKAKITVPDASAECIQQQQKELKQAEDIVSNGYHGTIDFDDSPKGKVCKKAWENTAHAFGNRELGYIEIGTLYHNSFELKIFFKSGVVVRVKGSTKTLNFPQFLEAALNRFKVVPKMSSTTMQNGFGAKIEWPQADYDLPNGAHLTVTQTGSMSDAPLENPLLQFDLITKEGLDHEATKRAAEQSKVDPFAK